MSKNTKNPSKYGWILYTVILVFIAVNLFGGIGLQQHRENNHFAA